MVQKSHHEVMHSMGTCSWLVGRIADITWDGVEICWHASAMNSICWNPWLF